jgi:hypothetical protein
MAPLASKYCEIERWFNGSRSMEEVSLCDVVVCCSSISFAVAIQWFSSMLLILECFHRVWFMLLFAVWAMWICIGLAGGLYNQEQKPIRTVPSCHSFRPLHLKPRRQRMSSCNLNCLHGASTDTSTLPQSRLQHIVLMVQHSFRNE